MVKELSKNTLLILIHGRIRRLRGYFSSSYIFDRAGNTDGNDTKNMVHNGENHEEATNLDEQ